ncbi:MAG: putative metal-binding motif-containing protein, partial [Myxococcota bacterium]|nr:putative metal-binding motif-containing protein [Myxococcota bacterium]
DITEVTCDATAGYVIDGGDCDDDNPEAYPGRREVCDGADNDCDGLTDDEDEDMTGEGTWYLDADGDGYGDPDAQTVEQCEQPSGYSVTDTDCDDSDADISPDGTESCNEVDDDCDGNVDDGVTTVYYADSDEDGYGSVDVTTEACSQPSGYVTDYTDCDDADASASPGGEEVCDGIDNDCDGFTDENESTDAPTWYADSDDDGFGDPERSYTSCEAPSAYVSDATDCDDGRDGVNPDATETCSTGYDDDCDDDDNDEGAEACTDFYLDADDDGYGTGDTACLCEADSQYGALNDEDCDDTQATVNPGELENCNTADDDDCNGETND